VLIVALKVPFDASLIVLMTIRDSLLMNCTLRLYSNNHTPADGDDVTDYTEATFPGYAGIPMTTWSAAALNASNKAEVAEAAQIFTAGVIITPEDIYGIFVTDDSSGDLIYAEENPAGPVTMSAFGQTFSYLPRFTLDSEF